MNKNANKRKQSDSVQPQRALLAKVNNRKKEASFASFVILLNCMTTV